MRCAIDIEREGVRLTGFAGLPTLHRPDPGQQYLFVNGRPVKDRLLIGARARGLRRFAAQGALSPARALRDARPARGRRQRASGQGRGAVPRSGRVRGLIVGALRQALEAAGHRASATGGGAQALARFRRRRLSPLLGRAGLLRLARLRRLAPGHRRGGARAGLPRTGRRRSRGLASPARTRAPPRAAGVRPRRPPAGRGAGAAARDLHRRADPRRRGDRRPARRPRAPGLRAHEGASWPTAASRARCC